MVSFCKSRSFTDPLSINLSCQDFSRGFDDQLRMLLGLSAEGQNQDFNTNSHN